MSHIFRLFLALRRCRLAIPLMLWPSGVAKMYATVRRRFVVAASTASLFRPLTGPAACTDDASPDIMRLARSSFLVLLPLSQQRRSTIARTSLHASLVHHRPGGPDERSGGPHRDASLRLVELCAAPTSRARSRLRDGTVTGAGNRGWAIKVGLGICLRRRCGGSGCTPHPGGSCLFQQACVGTVVHCRVRGSHDSEPVVRTIVTPN